MAQAEALQRLLTHSFSGRALAVKRVTENRGKRTAGVDGETWSTPQQKVKGVERLKDRQHKAKPLKRSTYRKQMARSNVHSVFPV